METSASSITNITAHSMGEWQSVIYAGALQYGPTILLSILISVCGIILARILTRWTSKALEGKDIEPPEKLILVRTVRLVTYAVSILVILVTFGVNFNGLIAKLGVAGVIELGPRVLLSVLFFVSGKILARILSRWTDNALDRRDVEPPVRLLMVRAVRFAIYALALMIILDQLGVKINTLVAGLGVVGVGVGLATQGVLSNIVSGLTIIFTKPFKVGDYVELNGVSGTVSLIELSSSTIFRGDLSRVIIPNRQIVGEVVRNFGNIRQLDLSVAVAYSTDVQATIEIVRKILLANPRVLRDPAPFVGVSALEHSAIMIAAKPWTKVADFGLAQAEIYQTIISEFRQQRIEIPYPQREVRLINSTLPAPKA